MLQLSDISKCTKFQLVIMVTFIICIFIYLLPYSDGSQTLALLLLGFTFIGQNDWSEVCGSGSEGLWEVESHINWIAVGNRARHRSQSALSGQGHKAYTWLQQSQIQYQ